MVVTSRVRAKEGRHAHFLVDYANLKADTTQDSYLILHMDNCIDGLGDSTICSTSDANSRYCHVEIAKQDHHKKTYTSNHGLFRFTRMHFRLKNAPETF